jgi:hypothetical protein
MRPQAMHMVNLPQVMENVITLFKTLMNEKMRSRMHTHNLNNPETLLNAVGKDVLPEEYGGTNGTVQDHIGNNNNMGSELNDNHCFTFSTRSYSETG